jgi:signal transduction histidine kinase
MTRSIWPRDSITLRFALAIALSTASCLVLNIMADAVIGGPAFSPPAEAPLLARLPDILRSMDAAPADQRDALARAASTRDGRVEWLPSGPPVAPAVTLGLVAGADGRPESLSATLGDRGSVLFRLAQPDWSLKQPGQWLLRAGILVFSILVVSLAGASRLARPVNAFAEAARRFGADPNARPMPAQGPAEMRSAIEAFNTMQSQVQRFVAGQAAMFAAISHDLRTPLTRIRLRGEFIEDGEQQARLFRDVDEMQAMVGAVLMFLRGSAGEEETTRLDLAELLRSIVDDNADSGVAVAFSGPGHAAYPGRPVWLRRAFSNIVDNAVKYGTSAAICLRCDGSGVTVTVTDKGPGLPAEALETVFAPFHRQEPSRNRNTGGMGLGLTSARACFRAHGGDITLGNSEGGGLRAVVVLPLPALPRSGAAPATRKTSLA